MTGSSMRWRPLAACVLGLGVAALTGCESVGPEPTEPLSEAALVGHLEFLADDSIYGRSAGSVYERRAAEYIRDEFIEYGLTPGVSGYLQVFTFDDSLESQNVIGMLPGEGALGHEWVIVGAHYDHLGWAQVSPDSIVVFNGADDNASGTALLLELARFMSHYYVQGVGAGRDRRSFMFHAYGAEEAGLLGSIHFCQNPVVLLGQVAAMVDLDMVGRMQNDQVIVNGAASVPAWRTVLDLANTPSLTLLYDDVGLRGSDHVCFHVSGRPAVFLTTGLHPEYHTPWDDVWLIDLDGMLRVGELTLGVLEQVATAEDWPQLRVGASLRSALQ